MGFGFLVMTGQALLMSPKGRNASRNGLVKLWEYLVHKSLINSATKRSLSAAQVNGTLIAVGAT